MTTRQTFGSALRQPWALVLHGANSPPGKRPGTSVAYLTDDEGDSYLGGFVWFGRQWTRGADGHYHQGPTQWHYSYKHARQIPKADVVHIFASTDKSKYGGPSPAEILRAKKALPITPREEPVAMVTPEVPA